MIRLEPRLAEPVLLSEDRGWPRGRMALWLSFKAEQIDESMHFSRDMKPGLRDF